jgi:hypothetical protein
MANQEGGILLFPVVPITKGRRFVGRCVLDEIGRPIWGSVLARRSAYDTLLPGAPR